MSNPTEDKVIVLGENKYNAVYLRRVSEKVAVRSMPENDRGQVVNAWKQANGKTVRNHSVDRAKELDKAHKKPQIVEMAEGMGIEFESDANKMPIIELIVAKENEEK